MQRTDQAPLVGPEPAIDIASPTLRLFNVLESIAALSCHFTLQELVEATSLPKPSVFRMLQQLEAVGIVARDSDERHYQLGPRMRTLASRLLLNDSLHAARHRILAQLCEAVGESCNLTAIVDGEVLYLDRAETAAPLRFYLQPGTRVPVHASASGKLLLGMLPESRRRQLVRALPLERFTPNTIVDADQLLAEVDASIARGWSVDEEEYLPGLVCLAVLVPCDSGNLAVAMQGPSIRLDMRDSSRYLTALKRAARDLGRLEDGATPVSERAAGRASRGRGVTTA